MGIDRAEFKRLLRRAGLAQYEAAAAIGISENGMSGKVKEHRDFTQKEIVKLCVLLKVEDPVAVFFPELKEPDAEASSPVGKAI